MNTNPSEKPGKARRIIGDILIALTVLFIVAVSVVMIHRIRTVVLKSAYERIFRREWIIFAILLLFSLDVRFGIFTKLRKKPALVIGWILRSALCIATGIVLFFSCKMIIGGMFRTNRTADSVLVLGMALENGQPTQDLLYRVDAARDYLNAHPDSTLILTGGNPDDSGRTEAAVMQELLIERGVPADKMRLEDQAASTIENFRNSAKMVDPSQPVVVISSNYHMDRAVNTAKQAGFTNILRYPGSSSIWQYPANMLWEVMMSVNELTRSFSSAPASPASTSKAA